MAEARANTQRRVMSHWFSHTQGPRAIRQRSSSSHHQWWGGKCVNRKFATEDSGNSDRPIRTTAAGSTIYPTSRKTFSRANDDESSRMAEAPRSHGRTLSLFLYACKTYAKCCKAITEDLSGKGKTWWLLEKSKELTAMSLESVCEQQHYRKREDASTSKRKRTSHATLLFWLFPYSALKNTLPPSHSQAHTQSGTRKAPDIH